MKKQYLIDVLHSDPVEELNNLTEMLSYYPHLMEALIVKLANKLGITWRGRRIKNTLINDPIKERRSLDIHSFSAWTAGATAIIFAENPDLELFLAVVKNKRHIKLPQWGLPEGFATAGPLLGGDNGYGPYTLEQQVEAEALIEVGENGYEIIADKYNIDFLEGGSNWQKSAYDHSLYQTIIREIQEEIGLANLPKLFALANVSFYDPNRCFPHIKTYFTTLLSQPLLLQPEDLDEVEFAAWVPLNSISVCQDDNYIATIGTETLPLAPNHIQHIKLGVQWARDQQIKREFSFLQSNGEHLCIGESVNSIYGYLHILGASKILGDQPQSEFGLSAHTYHQKLCVCAEKIKKIVSIEKRMPTSDEIQNELKRKFC